MSCRVIRLGDNKRSYQPCVGYPSNHGDVLENFWVGWDADDWFSSELLAVSGRVAFSGMTQANGNLFAGKDHPMSHSVVHEVCLIPFPSFSSNAAILSLIASQSTQSSYTVATSYITGARNDTQ